MRFLLKEIIKPLYFFINSKKEREFYRLLGKWKNAPRFKKEENVKFLDFVFDIPDPQSFVWQFKEIFVDDIYRTEFDTEYPVIYDCGANIGMASLYFKTITPKAKIKAFEADPSIAEVLSVNLQKNGITGVEVINKAVWIDEKGVSFSVEGADGGSILGNDDKKIYLQSISLKELIRNEERVHFLKMDIEGAEYEIIKDCSDILHLVDKLYIEYHSFKNGKQQLGEILTILEQSGFKYYLTSAAVMKNPFLTRDIPHAMDLQVHLFAFRR